MIINKDHFNTLKTKEEFVLFLKYTDKHVGDEVEEYQYNIWVMEMTFKFIKENRIQHDLPEESIYKFEERFLEFLRKELEEGTNQISLFDY